MIFERKTEGVKLKTSKIRQNITVFGRAGFMNKGFLCMAEKV